MTDRELLEYAIYHWIFGGGYEFPGKNDKDFNEPIDCFLYSLVNMFKYQTGK